MTSAKKVCVVGGSGASGDAVAKLLSIAYVMVEAAGATDQRHQIGLRTIDVLRPDLPPDTRNQYGPVRKGRGGKIRRW